MLLISNMENVSQGPFMINTSVVLLVDDIYILRNKNAQKSAYGIPGAEIAVYLTYKRRHWRKLRGGNYHTIYS